MDLRRQRKAVGGYYASVAYMDAQVGKVMAALKRARLDEKTIVIFTSDHGYHLGEHDFWAKVSLHEESALVPLTNGRIQSTLAEVHEKPAEVAAGDCSCPMVGVVTNVDCPIHGGR